MAAGRLFGCYRRDDAADPKTYAVAVAAVLATYPPDVVKRVTDPRTGLAGRSKWLPTVSEVREACEEIVQREAAAVERERRIAAQLAARKVDDERRASQPRPTYQDLLAKHGPDFGINRFCDPIRDMRGEVAPPRQKVNHNAIFERDCVAAGMDRDSLYSPALAALVERQKQGM